MDRRQLKDERGFTLIEVMVAALVLCTGMLAVLTIVVGAQATTFANLARANGTALAREVVEASRAVPYEQLNTDTLAATLLAQSALGDDAPATPGWQIRRGTNVYTVSVGACAMDDTRDGTGSHDAGRFCASGQTGTPPTTCASVLRYTGTGLPGANAAPTPGLGDCGIDPDLDGRVDALVDETGTTCTGACAAGGLDTTPADSKRIVVLVRWDRGQGARYVLQGSVVANPGLSGAPAVSAITSGVGTSVTSSATTSIPLTITTSASAGTVAAYVDGSQVGSAAGTGTTWTYSWALGSVAGGSVLGASEVPDGTYLVGFKAFDTAGQFGQARSLTVVVNRSVPYPPQGLLAGRNGSAVDLTWHANAERDVELYRVYRDNGLGGWVLVCQTDQTACQDPSPPDIGTPSYQVVALDRDAAGTLREGRRSLTVTVPLLNTAPGRPTALTVQSSGGTTVLRWSAPAGGDPDLGDSIDHYTIYRDGSGFGARYDTTASGTATSWTDTQPDGQTHTYYVTAVDTHLAESSYAGPVTG